MIWLKIGMPELGTEWAGGEIAWAVQFLADANAAWFQAGNMDLPPITQLGITYDGGTMQREHTYYPAVFMVNHPERAYACRSIVAYDVGWRRAHGENAIAVVRENAPYDFHVLTEANGVITDPSAQVAGLEQVA